MADDILRQPNEGGAGVGATPLVHDHSGATQGGQIDWDLIWADAVHDHSSAAEGGATLTSPTIVTPSIAGTGWGNAGHGHAAASSGGQIDHSNLSNIPDASTTQKGHAVFPTADFIVASGSVTIQDESITSRRLAPTTIEKPCTGNTLINSGSDTDITGCTTTFTPAIASVAIVIGTFGFINMSANDIYVGVLDVDGSNEAQQVNISSTGSGTERHMGTQIWIVPLSVASHTLKLQASRATGAGTATVQAALTTMVVILIGDANVS